MGSGDLRRDEHYDRHGQLVWVRETPFNEHEARKLPAIKQHQARCEASSRWLKRQEGGLAYETRLLGGAHEFAPAFPDPEITWSDVEDILAEVTSDLERETFERCLPKLQRFMSLDGLTRRLAPGPRPVPAVLHKITGPAMVVAGASIAASSAFCLL